MTNEPPRAPSSDPSHAGAEEDLPPEDERVPITPTLVILGVLAVALGVFSALVMSARSLAP